MNKLTLINGLNDVKIMAFLSIYFPTTFIVVLIMYLLNLIHLPALLELPISLTLFLIIYTYTLYLSILSINIINLNNESLNVESLKYKFPTFEVKYEDIYEVMISGQKGGYVVHIEYLFEERYLVYSHHINLKNIPSYKTFLKSKGVYFK